MSHQYNRSQLYHLVWSKPVSQLGKELNVSESLIRNNCQKYEIPLPKSGYWSKVKFGKKVKIPILPPRVDLDNVTINFQNPLVDQKASESMRLTRKVKEIESQLPLESIAQNRLTNPDILVAEASNYFKNSGSRSYLSNGLC
ncbi:MAG: hypothetical protein IPL46_25675 [Saprospiraceae bacterium]|nr:hypothetical protein [Saprospiraceae bacterium]